MSVGALVAILIQGASAEPVLAVPVLVRQRVTGGTGVPEASAFGARKGSTRRSRGPFRQGALVSRSTPTGIARIGPRFDGQVTMRLSQVPVQSVSA